MSDSVDRFLNGNPDGIWEDEDLGGDRDGEGLGGWVRFEDADIKE